VLELNSSNLEQYLLNHQRISCTNLQIQSLSGGVSALVFKITTSENSFILKQACKKLRVQDDWFSDPARIEREFLFLEAFKNKLLPGNLAQAIWHDPINHILAMTVAPAPAAVWKTELLLGNVELCRAHQAGKLLASIHKFGFDLKKEFPLLLDKKIFHQLRIEPFYERLALNLPYLANAIQSLKQSLLEKSDTICHGDFSPKNLLLHPEGMTLVDHETAHFGDPTMDIGFFLAHLTLKGLRSNNRKVYSQLITAFLNSYALINSNCDANFQHSSLGHLAVVMLTRVLGTSRVDYLNTKQKEEAKKFSEALLLNAKLDWGTYPTAWL